MKSILYKILITRILITVLISQFIFICNKNIYGFNDTLAIINKKVITVNDFISFYKDKLIRYGLNDTYDLRLKYLLNLVSDELLIAEAKSQNLHKTDKAIKELKRIQTQELLNAYVTKHISNKINVTENDLKYLFIKLNTKIKVRHLFARTKDKADSLFKELQNGKSFEQLAKENFNDPVLKENGGLLGYISIDEMDPEFESVAFSMKIGEVSKPVKTVYGYSIIKVEDIKQNPFTTEYEFLKSKEKLKMFARKRAFEKAAKEYSQMLRENLNTKFNHKLLSKFFLNFQNDSLILIVEQPSNISTNDLNKIVVTSKLENWSLKKLINELNNVPEKQKKWIHTQENLEDFIAGLINRKYIIKQAEKEKLNENPDYKQKVDYNFDTYLLTEIENKLKSNITISTDSIKVYYEKNKDLFKTKPQVRLSSILLNDSTLVDTILSNLKKGVQFDLLAKKYSIQKITAERGGDIGYFTKEELYEYGDKIFSMNVGEWIGPLINDGKFLFLKCTDKKGSEIIPFEQAYREIEEMLKNFRWFKLRNEYVESLKNKFSYKINKDKLKYLKINNNI